MLSLTVFHERLSIACIYAVKLLSLSSEPLAPYFLSVTIFVLRDLSLKLFIYLWENFYIFFCKRDSVESKLETHFVSYYVPWTCFLYHRYRNCKNNRNLPLFHSLFCSDSVTSERFRQSWSWLYLIPNHTRVTVFMIHSHNCPLPRTQNYIPVKLDLNF